MANSERLRWPDDSAGPWEVEMRFDDRPGSPERCFEIRITWAPAGTWEGPPEQVSTSLLRALPISRLIAERRRWRAQSIARQEHVASWAWNRRPGQRLTDLSPPPELVAKVRRELTGPPRRRGGRQRAQSLGYYALVAEVYRAAYSKGEKPTVAVAEAMSLSPSGAAKAVRTARRLELLGRSPGQGRAGGIDPSDQSKEEGT